MRAQDDTGSYPVHLGLWTNWSRGPIFGPTLTLRRQDADLLVGLTALFVSFVFTCIWRIICFALHRYYSSPTQQDLVYHQRQVLLRNSPDPQSGIHLFSLLLWNHRKNRNKVRLILATLVALICSAAFTAASGFSSQISSQAGPEVLVRSLNCGSDIDITKDGQYPLLSTVAEKINAAADYARQCYSDDNNGIKTVDCRRFVRKRLDSHIDSRAGCPFQDEVCRLKNANVRVDSGYMDSRDDLGLNSPLDDKVLVRNVIHCAPLTTIGFSSQKSSSIGNLTLYHYGSTEVSTAEVLDYVGTASSMVAQVRRGRTDVTFSSFTPIEAVFRSDADTHIIFLSGNGVGYLAPSSDQWYRVSSKKARVSVGNAKISKSAGLGIYLPLDPASPLGCTDQYQFCREDSQNCGPLASSHDAALGAAKLFDSTFLDRLVNSTSTAVFKYVVKAVVKNSYASPWNYLRQLGPGSLASQNTLINAFQGALPSNQWHLDVVHWSHISMALIQAGFLDTAYFDPKDPSDLRIRKGFTSPDLKELCNSQKVRSPAYGSFSLFGLLFILVVGSLITITSYLLEPASEFLYKRWGYWKYAHLEWATNGTMQLHRLAHEELGFGTWAKGTKEIPITKDSEPLGCIDLTDPEHPVLHRPSREMVLHEA
ncbi:hypothetical protein F4825DRAFT_471560 [Nemania diffusa]|nr:hypothetical protein F4825DRAFT_471560 [Nemania diffusa]